MESAAAAESTSEPEIRPAMRPVTEGELLTAALSSLQKKLEENQAKAGAGAGAATGYAMSGGLTLLSQKLSTSTSELMRTIGSSGLPGQIVTAVMVVGGTMKRYASGEIDTEEFIIELGDKEIGRASCRERG